MTPLPTKKVIIVVAAVIAAIIVIIGFLFWNTSPRRTLNAFLKAIESGNQEAAFSFVSDTLKSSKRENIEWFVEDWASAETISTIVVTDEAWRSLVKTEVVDGQETPLLNKYGYEDKELKPTPRYFAHHYQAYITVEFDEFEDPVIIKLKRNTDDTWSPLAQLFRGWKVTGIRYQPLDEEDFEDLEFEVDEDGNLIPVDGEAFDTEDLEEESDEAIEIEEEDTEEAEETTEEEGTENEETEEESEDSTEEE